MDPGATEGTLVVPNREGEAVGEPSLDRPATRLAYVSRQATPDASGPQQESRGDVWLADLASGTQRLVVEDGAMPQVSPDGATIAFNRRGHEYLVASGGGEPTGPRGGRLRRVVAGRHPARDVHERRHRVRVAHRRRPADGRPDGRRPQRPDGLVAGRLAAGAVLDRDGDAEIYLVGSTGRGSGG